MFRVLACLLACYKFRLRVSHIFLNKQALNLSVFVFDYFMTNLALFFVFEFILSHSLNRLTSSFYFIGWAGWFHLMHWLYLISWTDWLSSFHFIS